LDGNFQQAIDHVKIAGVMVLLTCPSVLALLWIAWRSWRARQRGRSAYLMTQDFRHGVAFHFIGAAITPGIPLYLMYEWSKCAGGCASGLALVFILPFGWLFFALALWVLRKARVP
jgi:hypothetical protein